MTRALTVKQRKFLRYVAQGMSGAEAARKAGYSERAAKEIASENLTKPNVRQAFLAVMERAGITDERLAQVMKEGLEANRSISAAVGTDANERTMDVIDVPDHHARHKFLKTAVDIKGIEAAKQVTVRDQTLEDLLTTLDDGGSEDTAEGAG